MIEIHWPILLAQAVTFFLAVLVLWKFAWGPLTAFMEKRRQDFQKTIDEQSHKRDELDELERRYSTRLSELKRETEEAMRKAIDEGRKAGEALITQAHVEAKKVVDGAQAQMREEKERLSNEIRKESVQLAVQITEKLLQQTVDKKLQDKLEFEFFKGWDTKPEK